MKKNAAEEVSQGRLIARVIRELLKTESFDTLADLTDVLKYRLARYRISWTNDDLSDAYRWIETNHPLTAARLPRQVSRIERPDESPQFTPGQASAILARIRQQLGTPAPVKTMPTPEFITQREADCQQALEMVAKEMQASIERCEALESAVRAKTGDQQ